MHASYFDRRGNTTVHIYASEDHYVVDVCYRDVQDRRYCALENGAHILEDLRHRLAYPTKISRDETTYECVDIGSTYRSLIHTYRRLWLYDEAGKHITKKGQ